MKMDTSERDRAKTVVGGKSSELLTRSLSSEDSDSWTLVGKNAHPLDKEPSGVEITEMESEEEHALNEEDYAKRKQRHDSQKSIDSQLDESSDGISIISESDATSGDKFVGSQDQNYDLGAGKIHFKQKINLNLPEFEPLTPPYTPDVDQTQEDCGSNGEAALIANALHVQKAEFKSVEKMQSIVEHRQPLASWVIFGIIGTAMAAVIIGNAMRLQARVDTINFEHEKRISELELENNILKNEMNKLRHLYTRSELEEQVQRAEFDWMETWQQQAATAPVVTPDNTDEVEKQHVRKVPPQDSGVKRKVVWSGDDEEPMLVVDKDYVLPAFCYNQDKAVQDDLFFEYSTKYCDVKKRKIEAKQKKVEMHKMPKKENYNKLIHETSRQVETESAPLDPTRLASPFNIDYKKAFDAIKSEGIVIVEALGSILDLSPEAEATLASNPKLTAGVLREGEPTFSKHETDTEQSSNKRREGVVDRTNNKNQEYEAQGERQEFEAQSRNTHKSQDLYGDTAKLQPANDLLDGDDSKINFQTTSQTHGYNIDDLVDNRRKHEFGARDKDSSQGVDKRVHHDQESGEREKIQHTEKGYHQERYRRDERKRDEKRHDNGHERRSSQKDPNSYYEQQKHRERQEKRYKESGEYHQNGEHKHGDWHEKRRKGREEYRVDSERKQNQWHGKHYKDREYRQNNEQKHGGGHEKRYNGKEEYRRNGGKQKQKVAGKD